MALTMFVCSVVSLLLWMKFHLKPVSRHCAWVPGLFSLIWLYVSLTSMFGSYVWMAIR